jgi:hypothetical protein
MPFKFKPERRKVVDLGNGFAQVFDDTETTEEETGIINGQKARSVLEWRVAQSLWKLRLDFFYQYPLLGGTQRRGGYVVDFLIFVAPNNVALEVQGDRWHTTYFSPDENMRRSIIESILGSQIKYVFENELQTQVDTDTAVKKVIYA